MKDNASQDKKSSNAVANAVVQKKSNGKSLPAPSTIQLKENNTGMPDNLKSGVENLSGHDMSDVNVHYNSDKPAQVKAHAYAQGTDIHVASGQEKHLPHEAWHVVQQKQGRVKPTMQMKGKNVNTDNGLESEADRMGEKAASLSGAGDSSAIVQAKFNSSNSSAPIQRAENEQATVTEEDIKGLLEEQEKKYVAAVSPGTLSLLTNTAGAVAEENSDAIEGATGAGGVASNAPDLLTGLSGQTNDDSFSKASKDAKGNTAGLGGGSAGVIGATGATAGLAASVGKGAGQAYGAYGDYSEGKFDKSKGGKGLKSVATGMGRGLATAGDITTNALKTTQAISAVTGNATAYGAAAAGLGPMAMITSGFQGVKGVHNAILNKSREAKAEDLAKNAKTPEQKELFEGLAQNKKEKKQKGMVDAALGAGGMVAAGLMLNPVTAPAGLAIGAALGLGQGAFAAFKAIRQKGRDSASEMDKKAALTPEEIFKKKREEYSATKKANENSKLPWKKYAAYKASKKLDKLDANPQAFGEAKSDAYKKSSKRLNSIFDKNESSESQKEKRDGMAEKLQGLDPELQNEAMSGVMGINKYEKNADGTLKMEKDAEGNNTKTPATTPFFKTQILKLQADFVKKQPAEAVAAKAKELSSDERFSSEENATRRLAAALGMDEGAAEKEMLSSKLK